MAVFGFGFAIALTFLEDWCVTTKRPHWLCFGISTLSVIMFIADGVVILAICVRIMVAAIKDVREEIKE
jgi:hypothetical protein